MKKRSIASISKSVSSGITPLRSNPDYWANGTIPWLKTEQLGERLIYDTNEKISAKALNETGIKLNPVDTLSIAMYGEGKTRGNVSLLKREMTTNQACCNVVIDKTKASPEFIYYCLKNQYSNLRRLSSGVRKNLNAGDIKGFEITIPDRVSDQENIARVLSNLDDKIELNNQINAELEAMAKRLYDYWFVQFDFPMTAAQAASLGRPALEGHPYKSSGGKMVHDKELNRRIPKNWSVGTLLNLTSLVKRGISPKYVEEGGISVLNQKCIRDQSIQFKEARRHGIELDESNERLLQYLDVVVNSTGVGTLGRVAFVKRLVDPTTTVDSHVTIVRANEGRISKTYLAWSMLRLQPAIEAAAVGSTGQIELSKTYVEQLKLIVPDEHCQDRFAEFASPIIQVMASREKENEELTQLRDWLLPMLMNGQVTVG